MNLFRNQNTASYSLLPIPPTLLREVLNASAPLLLISDSVHTSVSATEFPELAPSERKLVQTYSYISTHKILRMNQLYNRPFTAPHVEKFECFRLHVFHM
jgi:hypothetical protein